MRLLLFNPSIVFMKEYLSRKVCCLFLLLSTYSFAAQQVEVEIGHGHLSPDHLLLKVGDKVLFNNTVAMDGGHSIGITYEEKTTYSPALEKNDHWVYEFARPGVFDFFLLEHPRIRGKVTIFAEDKMGSAVSDLRKEMVSYSIGFNFGEKVVKKLDNLDLLLFVAGLKHAYNDEPSKLDEEEMAFIIADYERGLKRKATRVIDRMKASNLKSSNEFLAKNGKHPGVVESKSGLQYKVLTKGRGKQAAYGDLVKVHYKGTFINGTEFDNTYKTGIAEFALTPQILPGMSEGLSLMREGDKWQLFLPPSLGYGSKGLDNPRNKQLSIEPNVTLLFEVELVSVAKK